ncbi:NAD(P)-dependent oxidoreductase [Paenibacillus oralis]|uniref:NAD(P)-dependent oxidoreductase n=1 Tax=Paenibacillus oralis TaxID=2490856 RepID=A0A3P3TY53_9BACL|nr:NAD-dependent epimerase/dehydratase family protein [Paenibacillus oralis]RRJ62198.1 NAD(P)-dependent oxidoreductase [Paenibacillus oralis]
MNKRCLLGYTGYVGSTLLSQTQFDDLYNSKNIETIKGKEYDLLICAAAPAVKWKANQAPVEDLENIKKLMEAIKGVRVNKFVLISTVDIYQDPVDVDETTIIDPELTEPYGKHRFYLEQFIRENFGDNLIIRLPGLFGKGLKKNFIYDIIYNNALHLTHFRSEFQFYNTARLWNDVQVALNHKLSLVNFATQPVSAKEIAYQSIGLVFQNATEKEPVRYNMKSKFAQLFNPYASEGYMSSKEEVLNEISSFILEARKHL